MSDLYVLEGRVPVPMPDPIAWGRWMQSADRRVLQEHVGAAFVSTVFLGMDHNFSRVGPPLLFETMVFHAGHPDWDDHQERHATWDEAEAGHRRIVASLLELFGVDWVAPRREESE